MLNKYILFETFLIGVVYTLSMENSKITEDIKKARENIKNLTGDLADKISFTQCLPSDNNDPQKFSYKIKNTKWLIDESTSLYKKLNEALSYNLIPNFKLYSNFDNYITLKTFETMYNTFPILKNMYSKYISLGNYIELGDFYSPIKELEYKNIEYYNDTNNNLSDHKYTVYGLTANCEDIRLFIRSTNLFFTRRYNRFILKSLDDRPFGHDINTPLMRNILNSVYIKTHEIWHSSDTIFMSLDNLKYSCSSIEGYIHLLINKLPDNNTFLNCYNHKKDNINKSVSNDELITYLVKFITDKNNRKYLKEIIENMKVTPNFIQTQSLEFKDNELERVIDKIYEFLESGTEEEQKKLIKALMVTSDLSIKDDIETGHSLSGELAIKDGIKTKYSIFSNLTRYSRERCAEFSAENASLSLFADNNRYEYTSTVFAFELAYLEKQFKNIKGNKQNIDFNDIRTISNKKNISYD